MTEQTQRQAPPRVTTTEDDGAAPRSELGIVLTGGGARAAYQVGVLRGLARRFPNTRFPIITGVSAGAINAVFLAQHPGTLAAAVTDLEEIWRGLSIERVFRVDTVALSGNFARWVARLTSGGSAKAPEVRGLVDTEPLRETLQKVLPTVDGEIIGIQRNLEAGRLGAVALTTIDYATGQTITWVEGRDIRTWERPNRRSRQARLTIQHVLASAALPLLFPAVRLAGSWHGDGGIRLSAPLSPSIHLGASRVLVISTRYERDHAEADRPTIRGYPPPAQILGKLLNSVFLDLVDQDVARLQKMNELLERVPETLRGDFRPIEAQVLRPSEDLGRLAGEYEPELPTTFRFLTRSLGTRETSSPDFLSLLMFDPHYLERLMTIGERDAEAAAPALEKILRVPATPA
ncbi:MAG: patatin-like phospholipase family protein [Acidobacteria bacterium]|nr:patatin-like phospholipase family protein [Acidobacteriota bacterium]